jgi:hypothetical protein
MDMGGNHVHTCVGVGRHERKAVKGGGREEEVACGFCRPEVGDDRLGYGSHLSERGREETDRGR